MESCRSKWQWLRWRSKCSDVTEIDDTNRVVLGQDVSSCIVPVPKLQCISDFDRYSAYFRHLVNALVTLQEDFLPVTQTISSILNPFTSVSLTESRSLVSELFYWRKILNLYVPGEDKSLNVDIPTKTGSTSTLKSLVKTPEAFKVEDWNSPNGSAFKYVVVFTNKTLIHPYSL